MVLQLSKHHFEAIRQHGESTYPNECCGLLLGTLSNNSKTVVEVRAVENVWNAEAAELFSIGEEKRSINKQSNYAISPQTLLAVQKEVRDRTLQIVGIYHSHPNHPAIASECDRALAWEQYSYMIVSVIEGNAQEFLCWQLDSDRIFQAEEIMIVDNLV
ncbi:Mov34/MPN/PAD-1 family protein [Synechocystis sp. PCC 7509]|uniref:Mov34/MPN/PAD-1 family protein n=1 Tax=Synechocystis sp. PCC 7509 TaxID=927677 RepID=UPI0002ABBC31|nr:M67 family metallopeptidase [Synechocystis sp. PCC 7509]